MSISEKIYMLIGPALISFTFAYTNPTVNIHFMKLVNVQILAISNILSVGLAAIANSCLSVDKIRELCAKNFIYILILDSILCILIACLSAEDYVAVRYIGFAIMNAVTTTMWTTVMRDIVNKTIHKSELTGWQSFSKAVELYASLFGCLLVFIFPKPNVDCCIYAQCISNILLACSDYIAYNKLKKHAK